MPVAACGELSTETKVLAVAVALLELALAPLPLPAPALPSLVVVVVVRLVVVDGGAVDEVAGLEASPVTVTLPTSAGWNVQKYVNVPGRVKVNLKLLPGNILLL